MNNQFKTEFKMNYKKILYTILILGSMVFFSMMFFPTIAENMDMLQGFMQNDFMKNMMAAFGMNVSAFGSLTGFYSAYSSMWIVLVGSLFFSYFAAELIAKEQKQGTIEYLLSRPTTRAKVYANKFAVLVVLALIFMISLTAVGYASLEMQKKVAPYQLNINKHSTEIEKEILTNSQTISSWFSFTEQDFNTFSYGMLLAEYKNNKSEIIESGFKQQNIDEMFKKILESPENFFEEIKQNPSQYKDMFGGNNLSDEQFLAGVNESEKEYKAFKYQFFNSQDVVKDFYEKSPEFFLNKINQENKVAELNQLLNGKILKQGLYNKYSLKKFIVLNTYMLLIILTLASLSFAFSAIVSTSFNSSQVAMVGILIMYFMDSFGSITAKTEFLTKITPFGYINTNVTDVGYSLSIHNVVVLITITLVAYAVGLIKYRKKDFS